MTEPPGTADDWLREIYSSRWSAKFRRYCVEKFARFTDPVELMEDARQQLALSLQQRTEQGIESKLTPGYIMVAFRNAVTDLHRQRSGRAEPRAWLKAFGRLGQALFELYCLARLRRPEVLSRLKADPDLRREPFNPEQTNSLMDEMDQRGECEGKGFREEPLVRESGETVEVPCYRSPEEELIEAQTHALHAYLFRQDAGSLEDVRHLVSRFEEVRRLVGQRLELDDDQGFILHATLSGQLSEAEMGQLLGNLSVRQVRYKRQKALEKLKKFLQQAGLGLDELVHQCATGADFAGYVRNGAAEPLSESIGD